MTVVAHSTNTFFNNYKCFFYLDLNIRSIKTLGDTLHEKGFLYAGQFCYLMAEMDFCSYENKSSKLVLIGGKFFLKVENLTLSYNYCVTVKQAM